MIHYNQSLGNHWRFTDLLVCDYVLTNDENKAKKETKYLWKLNTYQKHILGLVVASFTDALCKSLLVKRLKTLTSNLKLT